MGCGQSKIENEEAVTRCKDRKLFMKEAVSHRNVFAAAHSAYAIALKNTGAALSDYAQGEFQNSSPSNTSVVPITEGVVAPPPPPPQGFDLEPPPPPPPNSSFGLQRAVSMPEMKIAEKKGIETQTTIIEEEGDGDDEEEDDEEHEKLVSRRRRGVGGGYKGSGSVGGGVRSRERLDNDQSSIANNQPSVVVESRASAMQAPAVSHGWEEYIFPPTENMVGPNLGMMEEEVLKQHQHQQQQQHQRQEPQPVFEERPPKRMVDEVVEEVRMSAKFEEVPMEGTSSGGGGSVGKSARRGKSTSLGGVPSGGGEKRLVKGGVNLLQTFELLDDHFLKASESAHEVSKMLEATRLHYHSNFADNRGHIDHSARVMRVITWNRSFRGLSNVDDGKDDFDLEENETHATVLDKLLAWEKKLYDEVKAGELMKFEYQRKVATLSKLKKRASNSEALEKAKATVSHLHTRYIVDMQSMDSTVSEINRLRDHQLYPKLVQLVSGMAEMWEAMGSHHEKQTQLAVYLREIDISLSPKETTEHHHERTIQLWAVVQDWHVQFCKLIDNQKLYIKSLNNWLKLNLIPIESSLKEKVSSPPRVESPLIQALLHAWQDYIDRLQDGVARSAISNFAAVVHTIVQQQEDEMRLKYKCDETRKELSRKTRNFEDWYHKYMQRRTQEELGADDSTIKEAVAERQFQVDVVKKRLEEEEESYQKQCLHVREKSVASLKSRLPELFRAMREVASHCSEMYKVLRAIANRQSQHTNGIPSSS
ncbi:hypothetical protein ACFE04_004019 [Oxalis oulophora]